MEINAKQKYEYVIWKNCPYFTAEKNRRFRLGRISKPQSDEVWEVFDAKYRKWTRCSGSYRYARDAKLKEILEAQA